MITGKGGDHGGSALRPEATGFGLVYYVEEMIKVVEGAGASFKGKKVLVSGSGQVAQFAALKALQLGAQVLSFSDSKGALIAKEGTTGFTEEHIKEIFEIKSKRQELSKFGDKNGQFVFHGNGARPWKLVKQYDIALPSATQNEVDESDANAIIKAGCHYIAEGSNMGCDAAAIETFEKSRASGDKNNFCWIGSGKAANGGGVAVSGFEMAQNSQRARWTAEEVDAKLKGVMKDCFQLCKKTGEEFADKSQIPSLVVGANISGFKRVADAMMAHGDCW